MNKIGMALFVVLASTVFGLIFVKQIRVSQQEIADAIVNDYNARVSGAYVIAPQEDSTEKIERSLNTTDLEAIDANNAQIEAAAEGL